MIDLYERLQDLTSSVKTEADIIKAAGAPMMTLTSDLYLPGSRLLIYRLERTHPKVINSIYFEIEGDGNIILHHASNGIVATLVDPLLGKLIEG